MKMVPPSLSAVDSHFRVTFGCQVTAMRLIFHAGLLHESHQNTDTLTFLAT